MTGPKPNIGPRRLLYYPRPADPMNQPQTIIDKLWAAHEILRREDGSSLLWVDRHYVHEGSFHAFSKLAERGVTVAEPGLTFGVADHYVPTRGSRTNIANPELARMVRQVEENTAKHGVKLFGLDDPRQGIVHVVGPEQGLTLPGLLVVCGDSHTSTHGALGAYAFGIGASEVAHVLMTQTIWQKRPKQMRVTVDGQAAPGISGKDIVLAIIAKIGADGATGCALEFAGSAIRALSIEGRLTLCNMSIEAGARCGLVAPDETTFAYLKGRPYAPKGAEFDRAVEAMVEAPDRRRRELRDRCQPRCESHCPDRDVGHQSRGCAADRRKRARSGARAGREPRQHICAARSITWASRRERSSLTSRSTGCSSAPAPIRGSRTCARPRRCWPAAPSKVPGLVSAGSTLIKLQAEQEGLDRIFRDAGLEWGESGCSMCVGINGDLVASGERCASTTNRNFRGRQGPGARTHLMSPAMVAAAAVAGHLADVRPLLEGRKV